MVRYAITANILHQLTKQYTVSRKSRQRLAHANTWIQQMDSRRQLMEGVVLRVSGPSCVEGIEG